MATSFKFRPNDRPLLYNAKYQCEKCGHKWKLRRTSGDSKKCPIETCTSYLPVVPYKKIAINELVVYMCPSCKTEKKETRCSEEVNQLPYCKICQCVMIVKSRKYLKVLKRMFGEFKCHKCGRNWKSGNSWETKGQMCKRCNIMIYPFSLRPLSPPNFTLEKKEPHDQARCQMCQQLGTNCKERNTVENDVASADELPDEDDLRSILTDTSSLQDPTSREESLTPPESLSGDITPTENDEFYREEEVIVEATRRLAHIQLSKK